LSASGVNLTSDVPIAVSAKFSRAASGEKRALACEQIVTKQGTQINSAAAASDTLNANDLIATIDASNALNSSGAEGAPATIDAMGTGNTSTTIDAIDASNALNAGGSFAATRANEANAALNISAVPCKKGSRNEPQNKPSCAEPQDVLILLSLGAFDFPQQCFIRANTSGTRYFIRRPLPTRENHAAHQKISEIFSQWQR